METIISDIRVALTDSADERTKQNAQNFFKEKITFYGVKVPLVHKIAKQSYELIKDKSKKEIYELCEVLWKSGISEESYIAADWSYYIRKTYTPDDFNVFEHWLMNYVNNWASCDTLCNHTIGTFLEIYPQFISELKKWATSENRWTRRGSAVSLILPARKGMFLNEIFEIADILLLDTDDLVRKGYGWMLKAASEKYQQEVFEYVISKKHIMPRTSLRYAIEKMPLGLKAEAMKR